MSRRVLHADMDAFYAAIEQRDRPELRGRPVIVGAQSPRGVVAAASYEARVFGVRSAMPGFRARELCPQAAFLAVDLPKYSAVSDEVHRVFGEFTSEIEPLALDEAFLDVTGSIALFGGELALARRLKERVREETGLPLSAAIAPNKSVAKIACAWSKPDGLLVVPPEAVRWLLDPLPARRLWGVGPVLAAALEAAGLRSVGDVRGASAERLRSIVGERASELSAMAAGFDPRPVQSHREPRSCGEECTFPEDVSESAVITATLTAHAETVARRLRQQGYRGRTVILKVKLGRKRGTRVARGGAPGEPIYPLLSRSRTLPAATDDGSLIRRVAIELWMAAGIAEPVRLVGVSVASLEREPGQLELFAEPRRGERLGPVLDAIRSRFGAAAIGRAVVEPNKQTPSDQRKR